MEQTGVFKGAFGGFVEDKTLVTSLSFISALVFLTLLPVVHLGVFYSWWTEKEPVDKDTCDCSCWDTIFKGSYESDVYNTVYHHVYFNVTLQTGVIWFITITCVLVTYEVVRYVIKLAVQRRLRYTLLFVALTSVYTHYYAWWSYFNYLNDDFYAQWHHQLLFTLTEVTAGLAVLRYCDSERPIDPNVLMVAVDISVAHILMGGVDQFLEHLILGRALWSQVFRDAGLILPDVLTSCVISVVCYRSSRGANCDLCLPRCLSTRQTLKHAGLVLFLWLVGNVVIPAYD